MTIEPIGAVRPVPHPDEDSHSGLHEPATLVRQRAAQTGAAQTGAAQTGAAETDAARIVPALLELNGLRPSPAEVAAITARFAAVRTAVRSLYAVPEARYEEPGLTFHAAP